MTRARMAVVFTVAGMALLAVAATRQNAAQRPAPPARLSITPANAIMPPEVANGANASQNDYYNLGWLSFIALNWPSLAGGERGQPDTTLTIGATGPDGTPLPVVWQGYKDPGEVFLPKGAAPASWNTPPPPPPVPCPGQVRGRLIVRSVAKTSPEGLSALNEAGFNVQATPNGPLIDQRGNYVLFQQALNQSEFTYLVNNQYYSADQQHEAVQNDSFNSPPKGPESYVQSLPPWARQGATEIKASWRILVPGTDTFSRYFNMPAYFIQPNGTCTEVTVGLVGLHILRLTPVTHATWFWATFEQVDNVDVLPGPGQPATPSFNPGPNGTPPPPYPHGYTYEPAPVQPGQPLPQNPPVDVSRYTPIPPAVQLLNAQYRAALAGTVWQHYQMVNTLNPNPAGAPDPGCTVPGSTAVPNVCVMANTTIETYDQALSCESCHAFAFPIGPSKKAAQYQIFTFMLQHAQFAAARKRPLVPTASRAYGFEWRMRRH